MKGKNIIGTRRPINWQAREWLRLFASGRVTEEDARLFVAWKAQNPEHILALQQAQNEWQMLGKAAAIVRAQDISFEEGQRLSEHGWHRRRLLGMGLAGGVAAAAALAFYPPLELWPSVDELTADYRTAKGQQRHVQPASGLDLLLNTQTTLKVKSQRDISAFELLSGEMAVICRQFQGETEIMAGQGTVRLGVSDIELRAARSGRVDLRCESGKIVLLHPNGMVELAANQQLTYDNQQISPVTPAEAGASAWRSGFIVFRKTLLGEAITEINRYRPGKVILLDKQSADRQLSGRYSIHDLDQVLAQISSIFNLRMRELPGHILLLG
ncbi:FecR family protein [Sodalis ligni]|jgi:transmembrane sensor|uniref:FecR family protein n=1 Tax=Sodalis ligni TaxID=2697027 RepID=A0A4R1NGS8_9GAMM|nr:DUF4880 domain-containing protein [Sodalis ligni]TCL06179.1 FecR family protein [Sodalis ligni]